MRLLFAGTPDFAATVLTALLASEHDVVAVLTQPDRPAGRGRQLSASPVKRLSQQSGLPVLQPDSLRGDEIAAQLVHFAADAMIVVAYGLIIPAAILALPRWGCINVHASLLPRWRGAAPIQRAIAAGDTVTGVTIMQMEEGLDTGPMLHQKTLPLLPNDTGGSLHDRLAPLGASALLEVLAKFPFSGIPQDDASSCYATKLSKAEARIDWQQPAQLVHDRIRAFNPWPVAFSDLSGQTLRIWSSRLATGKGRPGEILQATDQGLLVACGDGALELLELQLPGKHLLPAAALLHGQPRLFLPGMIFQ